MRVVSDSTFQVASWAVIWSAPPCRGSTELFEVRFESGARAPQSKKGASPGLPPAKWGWWAAYHG